MDIHPYCTIIRYNEDEDIDDYYDDDGNMALDTLCVLGEGVMGGGGGAHQNNLHHSSSLVSERHQYSKHSFIEVQR